MKTVWGEIVLGWHRATRGPLMVALVLTTLLTLVLLPGRHDPNLVYTGYGWGLLWAVLLITSLWCGGTAYALDRERHRLTLTFTKPIHRLTLWWGRWLAVWLPFCAITLIACSLTLFRSLPEGRAVHQPLLPDLKDAAVTELARLRSLNRVPAGISEARLLRAVYEDLETRYLELQRSTPHTYHFALPNELPPHAQATFRLKGSPFLGAKDALTLAVDVATPTTAPLRLTPTHLRDTGLDLALPTSHLKAGETLSITLHRLDQNGAASVIFRPYCDVDLLLPGIASWHNLARFMITVMLTLGLSTALGVSLGCSFSLPVTLFTGVLALLACAISILSPSISAVDSAASFWSRIATLISETLANPFADLTQLNPLHSLLAGEALSIQRIILCCLRLFLPALGLCSLCALLSSVKDEDR